jgi:hypothetical protein
VPESNLWIGSFCWLRDGRIAYARQQTPDSSDSNLWQITVETQTGAPTGKPKRMTQWAGSQLFGLSASANAKRLVLQTMTFQAQAYLGELN